MHIIPDIIFSLIQIYISQNKLRFSPNKHFFPTKYFSFYQNQEGLQKKDKKTSPENKFSFFLNQISTKKRLN